MVVVEGVGLPCTVRKLDGSLEMCGSLEMRYSTSEGKVLGFIWGQVLGV